MVQCSFYNYNKYMQLESQFIHIWMIPLPPKAAISQKECLVLSEEEKARANRFYFELHRMRFIASRSSLRFILSRYLNVLPETLIFSYNQYDKPFLAHPLTDLQFNLSHSEDQAVLAVAKTHEVGIDIENIKQAHHDKVLKRYFSSEDYNLIQALPKEAQSPAFYQLWARKEAILKAIGTRFSQTLIELSVSLETNQLILHEGRKWFLTSLNLLKAYKAAVASSQVIKQISYFDFDQR